MDIKTKDIRRGDIYYAQLDPVLGSEQGGLRPVLVIQNDEGNKHSPTVIAAPVTSRKVRNYQPTHVQIPHRFNLPQRSTALLEQIRALDKCRLRNFVARLDYETMCVIDEAISISLGLDKKYKSGVATRQSTSDETDDEMVLCLCPTCASQFYNSPNHVIRRVDPTQVAKDSCTYCEVRSGYDFRIINQRKTIGYDRA